MQFGMTALHLATANGNYSAVSILLDAATINTNLREQVNRILVGLTSCLFPVLKGSNTPLHLVAVSGVAGIARLLLGHAVTNPNLQHSVCSASCCFVSFIDHLSQDGRAALHFAVLHGHVDVVEALLEHADINPDIRDQVRSRCPFHQHFNDYLVVWDRTE